MKSEMTEIKLTKEQKKHISNVVDRYFKMKRTKKVRQLKEWLKLHKN